MRPGRSTACRLMSSTRRFSHCRRHRVCCTNRARQDVASFRIRADVASARSFRGVHVDDSIERAAAGAPGSGRAPSLRDVRGSLKHGTAPWRDPRGADEGALRPERQERVDRSTRPWRPLASSHVPHRGSDRRCPALGACACGRAYRRMKNRQSQAISRGPTVASMLKRVWFFTRGGGTALRNMLRGRGRKPGMRPTIWMRAAPRDGLAFDAVLDRTRNY